MARQTSKGICTNCHGEFSKAAMTRHLETCEQRASIEAKAASGKRQKAQPTRKFHLVVEGRELPIYWMHLEVTASTTLSTLDRFLRDTWLECCGHLSAFEIGGVRYAVDAGMDNGWDMDERSMRVRLDKVFSPGQVCSYEYDYGMSLPHFCGSGKSSEQRGHSRQWTSDGSGGRGSPTQTRTGKNAKGPRYITCSRKRIARLMREQGLSAHRPRHRMITTQCLPGGEREWPLSATSVRLLMNNRRDSLNGLEFLRKWVNLRIVIDL